MSMTKFLKFINLCRVNDSNDFLGISPGSFSGSVIITLSKNIVIVVKVSKYLGKFIRAQYFSPKSLKKNIKLQRLQTSRLKFTSHLYEKSKRLLNYSFTPLGPPTRSIWIVKFFLQNWVVIHIKDWRIAGE